MYQVLLVIHVIITVAMIGMVLIQRTDADGLSGLGAGGGMSGFMTGRSKANFMTHATAILAGTFICTSLLLGILVAHGKQEGTIAEKLAKESSATPAVTTDAKIAPVAADKKADAVPVAVPKAGEKKSPSVPKPE